jgi:hypothetical protein
VEAVGAVAEAVAAAAEEVEPRVEAAVVPGAAAVHVVAAEPEAEVVRHPLARLAEAAGPAVATLRAAEVEDPAAATLPAAEAREDPAAGELPAVRLPSASLVAVEAAMRATAVARGTGAAERLHSARRVEDLEAAAPTLGASAVRTLVAEVASEAARSLAAVATSAAALATAEALAIDQTWGTADKSPRTGLLSVTGRASETARISVGAAQGPPLYLPIDLTSAEAASATVRTSGPDRILATGARALGPTDPALETGQASVVGLASGSPELAAVRGRTWAHSAREPQELRWAAASPAVLESVRALFPAWATIGRVPASRLKTEGAR